MRTLAEALISVFELLEAEGRVLKTRIALLVFVVVLFLVAGAFLFLGLLMLALGLHEHLTPRMGRAGSLAAVGAGAMLVTSVLFVTGFAMIGRDGRGNSHEKNERTDISTGGQKEPEELLSQGEPRESD